MHVYIKHEDAVWTAVLLTTLAIEQLSKIKMVKNHRKLKIVCQIVHSLF